MIRSKKATPNPRTPMFIPAMVFSEPSRYFIEPPYKSLMIKAKRKPPVIIMLRMALILYCPFFQTSQRHNRPIDVFVINCQTSCIRTCGVQSGLNTWVSFISKQGTAKAYKIMLKVMINFSI